MILLSLDPGIRGAGTALFRDNVLIAAAYVRNTAKEACGPVECVEMARDVLVWAYNKAGAFLPITDLAVEWPRTYGGRAAKGDGNSLFALSGVSASLTALLPGAKVRHFLPTEWKQGQQKPENTRQPYVVEAKVRRRLSDDELAAFERDWPGNVKHTWDLVDATGIGMAYLGRFERQRVYARE